MTKGQAIINAQDQFHLAIYSARQLFHSKSIDLPTYHMMSAKAQDDFNKAVAEAGNLPTEE